jgi:hypothetical protein
MAGSRRPPRWVWVYDPARAFRQSQRPVPPHIQHDVERRAQELIDSTLKPCYIQPPPKKAELNYLVDLYAKWHGPFLFKILFAGTTCPVALLRIKVRPTSVRRQ